ncbi:single-stranded DNA-binding protein [Microbacterium sp. NIBRBAC000506063]|uniref:single-stranded DNA-binding protein n=1 Tax=Microbacterium sp. NIBRBAC000506063 TaxID=2734618 RepID=UPI001BB70AFB|nr:single-stranded DNA-binding protein [Microbacterium sp. NIBRBAC000506063]QTV79698.1 single-stranded DNA-binding protein [Microbacterium sp. NIBRBAC000506063]
MAEQVTIVGNIGSEPHHMVTATGLSITKFRVGCTHRAYDSASGQWVDKHTNWYQVSTFRQVADHAHASLKLGDSVIVTGRVIQRQWEANGRSGTAIDLEADTVGHDLRWGTSTWTRKSKASDSRESDAANAPRNSSAGDQGDPDDGHQAGRVASSIDAEGWSIPGPAEAETAAV